MLLIVGSFKKMTTFATANEKDWFLEIGRAHV